MHFRQKGCLHHLFRTGLLVWVWAMLVPPCHSQPLLGEEYRVKAGFVYHFVRFTYWPNEAFIRPDNPFVMCIAATIPESVELFSLNNKIIRDRKMEVIPFNTGDDIHKCQILYIASDNEGYIQKRITEAENRNILTIGETKGFAQMGGMVNFFRKNDQLRFEVNLDAARKAGLTFSSQLLMSAEIIRKEP